MYIFISYVQSIFNWYWIKFFLNSIDWLIDQSIILILILSSRKLDLDIDIELSKIEIGQINLIALKHYSCLTMWTPKLLGCCAPEISLNNAPQNLSAPLSCSTQDQPGMIRWNEYNCNFWIRKKCNLKKKRSDKLPPEKTPNWMYIF